MTFCISRRGVEKLNDLPLTHGQFELIEASQEFLLKQLTIEQRYDLLISNFVEFRNAIHDAASEHAVRRRKSSKDFDSALAPINRTLLNFLSSARGYVEQVRVSSWTQVAPEIVLSMNSEYDAKLAYRAMEALRNYSQHRGLPVHTFGYSGTWVDGDKSNKERRMEAAVPSLCPADLEKDGNFKRAVLDELLALDQSEFPLLPWAKEYLGSLSAIQAKVRDLHKEEFARVCGLRHQEALRYCAFDNNSLISDVYALELDDKGRIQKNIYLGFRIEEAIDSLRQTNGSLIRFEAGHIIT